jgi:hypothetical protein
MVNVEYYHERDIKDRLKGCAATMVLSGCVMKLDQNISLRMKKRIFQYLA